MSRAGDGELTTALVASSVTMIVLTTWAIATRMWVRLKLKTTGLDDVLIVTSWLLLICLCVLVILSSQVALGHRRDTVSTPDYEKFLKFTIASSSSYSVGVPIAKMSFAVLYLRIIPGHKLVIANKCLIAFLGLQALEEVLVVVLRCRPVPKAWTVDMEGTCMNLVPLWWSTFVFNLCTDLFLFIQPIPSMWRLQLPVAKRVGLIAMLSLGLLVCAISVVRIVYAMTMGTDDTYDLAEALIWSEVEASALILCSCIPSLRQVIQQIPWLNHAFGLSSNKPSNNYYQSGSKKGVSIALHSRRTGNQTSKSRKHNSLYQSEPYGLTSRAIAEPQSKNDSTEEIIPVNGREGAGIMVTHEVTHDIEAGGSGSPSMNESLGISEVMDARHVEKKSMA